MESLEDESDFVIKVVGGVSANGQIIHVNDKPSFLDVISKVKVHKRLERQWGAAKSKKHHCWFEQSKGGDESSFPLVTFFNLNVVVSPLHVELSKEGELSKVIDEVGDEG